MVTIKAIRTNDLQFRRKEDGKLEISGVYELVSEDEKVLAKQHFGGYSDIKLESSMETDANIRALLKSIQEDLEYQLGFREGIRK